MSVIWNGITFPFASCPEPELFPTRTKEIEFPGVDGMDEMDMGRTARTLTVRGRLIDANTGSPSAADIEAIDTDVIDTLTDGPRTYPNVRALRGRVFNFQGAVVAGVATLTCEYEITFKQLKK